MGLPPGAPPACRTELPMFFVVFAVIVVLGFGFFWRKGKASR